MLFLVRTGTGMIMSQDLVWLDIKQLAEDTKGQVLSLSNKVNKAQQLCRWFTTTNQIVSPLTSKTIRTKWGVDLSTVKSHSIDQLIQLKHYPTFLNNSPLNKAQVEMFQKAWIKEVKPKPETVKATKVEPNKKELDPSVKQISISPKTSAREKSALINEMFSTISDFKDLLEKVPALLLQKQAELTALEKNMIDLYHIVELSDNLNAADGYSVYKVLREILRKRRVVKDEISTLQNAVNFIVNTTDAAAIEKFNHIIEGLDNRKYEPRALSQSEYNEVIRNPKVLQSIFSMESIS